MTDGFQQSGEPMEPAGGQAASPQGAPLGLVVDGSVTQGVEVRLDPGASVEEVKVGAFVTIQGSQSRFFGVVTDISLGTTDPRLKHAPPQVDEPFLAQVAQGTV